MKDNKIVKYIIGLVVAVFIGAIGSGVWEQLLKPIFRFTSTKIIEIMTYIFKGYINDIYREASNGLHEYHSLLLMTMIMFIFIMIYMKVMKKHPYSKDRRSKISIKISEFIKSNHGYYFVCVFSVTAISFLYISIIRDIYVNQIITYSNKSINIVSPYINENERLHLISDFSSVKNANDFSVFKNKIDAIANDNNLNLGKFIPF